MEAITSFIASHKRTILGIALFCLAPYAFYVGRVSDWSTASTIITLFETYAFYWMPIATYLFLFFAFFVKRKSQWHHYFITTAWLFLVGSLVNLLNAWHLSSAKFPTILRNVFVQISGNWPVGVFMTISLVAVTLLGFHSASKVINDFLRIIAKFINHAKQPIVLLLGLLSAVATASVVYWQINQTQHLRNQVRNMGYKGGSYTVWIYGVLLLVIYTALTLVGITFFFNTLSNWWGEFVRTGRQLRDFRLQNYLYRTLAGYLYTVIYLASVAFAAVAVPLVTMFAFEISRANYSHGVHLLHWLWIPGGIAVGAVATALVLVTLRLLFESAVALVHVAQNTAKLR